jgi:hypothetical protein
MRHMHVCVCVCVRACVHVGVQVCGRVRVGSVAVFVCARAVCVAFLGTRVRACVRDCVRACVSEAVYAHEPYGRLSRTRDRLQ